MNKGALANIDLDAAIARIAAGTLTKTIAAELGVAKQSLRERLIAHPKYKDAIKEQAASLVEDATEECMKDEAVMPVIARARLKLDAAHKWARARDPETWGDKTQVTGTDGKSLQINNISITFVQPEQGRLIEQDDQGQLPE